MKEVPEIRPAWRYDDPRGSLSVLEEDALPFPVRRIYYLHDVPLGAMRAEHAHRVLRQVMICMSGRAAVRLTDGAETWRFELDTPSDLLHVPPGLWRSVRFLEPGTVLCVLASRPHEPEDYIHNFEDFLAWARTRQAADPSDEP